VSRNRPYIGPSESQANAEALMRRSAPYTAASDTSFRVSWDFHRREPADLREAVRMARRAYADEIPQTLHEGPDSIGEGGTPRMTAKAEGYIFGSHSGSDAPKAKCTCGIIQRAPQTKLVSPLSAGGVRVTPDPDSGAHFPDCSANPQNQPLVSYYHAPFRACLETLSRGDGSMRRRAAIVSHITIGSQGPVHAAITEGAHPLDAKLVAWDALCSFLRAMTDMRLHLPKVSENSEAVA
jgi:hypothetical protein